MDIFQPVTKAVGFVNGRKKFYPDENGFLRLAEICIFSEPVYNPSSLEPNGSKSKKFISAEDESEDESDDVPNKCSGNSVARARKRLYDLVECNPQCNMMATLTLNGEDFPRDDWNAIIKKLSTWLDNMTRRKGLAYILVPEYHKDGKSIHFHGFVNESSLDLVRAINPKTGKPLLQNGRAVYNIANWKYGFTTAVRVGKTDVDQSASAKYVLKYVTKGQEKIGGRYYLHGGNLREPIVEYFSADFGAFGGAEWSEFEVTKNLTCKICRNPAEFLAKGGIDHA